MTYKILITIKLSYAIFTGNNLSKYRNCKKPQNIDNQKSIDNLVSTTKLVSPMPVGWWPLFNNDV